MDFHQFLVLSAISHSPLKLFKVQSSKAYRKSGVALAAPATSLPTAMVYPVLRLETCIAQYCNKLAVLKLALYCILRLQTSGNESHYVWY